jgi:hypothetical protein
MWGEVGLRSVIRAAALKPTESAINGDNDPPSLPTLPNEFAAPSTTSISHSFLAQCGTSFL